MMGHALVQRRRRLLLGALFAGVGASAAPWLVHAAALPSSAAPFWALPRELTLHRAATGESVRIAYWRDGRLSRQGYLAICHILRDVQENAVAAIDVRLLDLLRGVQGWLALQGHDPTLEVTSGFRTRATNARTPGAGVNSFHLHGRAVDGVFRDISLDKASALVSAFSAGGVGVYAHQGHFLHMDTGAVRRWVR